jgi:hypothetical protein
MNINITSGCNCGDIFNHPIENPCAAHKSTQQELAELRIEEIEAENWLSRTQEEWAEQWLDGVRAEISGIGVRGDSFVNVPLKRIIPIKEWPIVALKNLSSAIMFLAALLITATPSYSAAISDSDAVRAILGEARGEGYEGMYAVAHAIRNRGTLKGVYGKQAVRPVKGDGLVAFNSKGTPVEVISTETYQSAMNAWHSSMEGFDPTHGATHWENIKQFGKPYWADSMIVTFKHRSHVFMKKR